MIKTWGGIPIPFDWLQLYQGLQTGVVNGEYVQVPWQYVFKHHELNKYYTETGGAWGGNHLSMDLKQFNELPIRRRSGCSRAWTISPRSLAPPTRRGGEVDRSAEEGDRRLGTRPTRRKWTCGVPARSAPGRTPRAPTDPKLAERALAEQGLDSFIDTLKKGGAL